MKVIEIDTYNTNMTVSQATEKGQEYIEALDTSRMINMLIFKQTDNKTAKQISLILGEVRRFCNDIEHELFERNRKRILKEVSNDTR